MNTLFLLTAGAQGGAATQPGGMSSLLSFGMIVLVFVVFYFFAIRPQKKQEREANAMRNALTVGDEITTIGGIIGRVVKVTEETLVIETGKDRTKLHILKSAVRSVDVHAADTIEAAEKESK